MSKIKFLFLEEVDSTNSYVSIHASDLEDMTMIVAERQTAGRGQRGNFWESEPGKNLTFTLLYRPEVKVKASDQFYISMATALAACDLLESLGIEAKIKWPNDIYVGDKKIAGILIEHSVMGRNLEHSRIGMGLNVNQLHFVSDAPNPVSVIQLSGKSNPLSIVAAECGMRLERYLDNIHDERMRDEIYQRFINKLWRNDGTFYPFRHVEKNMIFSGRIENVDRSGILHVSDQKSAEKYEFAFKEVEFILK